MIVRADDPVGLLESRIAELVGPQKYNVWFRNATRFAFTDGFLRVSSPNHFIGDWVERHFGNLIAQAVREVTGNDFTLAFDVDPAISKALGKKQPDRQLNFMANNPERVAREHRRDGVQAPMQALKGRFDDFVVGPSNRLAYAAALNLVERHAECGTLFIHGGCGVGKTHLLQAICNALRDRDPAIRWRYVTGEEFTNDFVYACKNREQDAFRARYRFRDVLVIDDVHFFANKKGTQEELLHTFNAMDVAGKRIVFASDAPPKLIGQFTESLRSRFVAGVVVRIDSPDFQTRAQVLRHKAARMNVQLGEDAILYMAEHFNANIRELDGALLKVVHESRLTGDAITLGLVQRAVKDLARTKAPAVMLADIESIVSLYFGLTPVELHSSRKTRTIALARGVTMYLARKHTRMSFPEIGCFMGRKNHSTVLLADRRIGGLLQSSATVRWVTAQGEREQNLNDVVREIEEQLGKARSPEPHVEGLQRLTGGRRAG